jgi:hypothetical protein
MGAAAAITSLSLAGVMFGAPSAGASPVPTSGLKRVHLTSYQALPPPYKPGDVSLTTAAALAQFAMSLRADHIGARAPATGSAGCAGGISYTAALTYKSGQRLSLSAYACGGTISGNLTGDVKAFVKYLSHLIGLQHR